MAVQNPRRYTDDFKHRALALAKDIGISEAARKLGISSGNIYNWQKKLLSLGKVSKLGASTPVESSDELIRRLQKENSDLKKANIILKSAAAFFSQDHLK